MKQEPEYLTEKSLGDFLGKYMPAASWIHDKAFIGRARPDYRSDWLKILVEFDGYQHYTSASRIIKDREKDRLAAEAGYKTVRVPYFVQLSSYTVKTLFGMDIAVEQTYPHGFIDKACILPADFCELGLDKFKNDLDRLPGIKTDIISSLRNKISELGTVEAVVPRSLSFLLA